MIEPPETVRTSTKRNSCDGASEIPGGAALGHPRVWLEIDEQGFVDCGYCDKRFVLIGGPADLPAAAGQDIPGEINNIVPKTSDPDDPGARDERAI